MDLLRQTAESLAGRIRYIDMGGLNALGIQSDATGATLHFAARTLARQHHASAALALARTLRNH